MRTSGATYLRFSGIQIVEMFIIRPMMSEPTRAP